jgi:hypothetical protein
MTNENLTRFKTEINSFFALVVMNLVFGALAMAFGIQFIVASVTGVPGAQMGMGIRAIAGALAMIGFGLGFAWVMLSARILKGINGIRREFHRQKGEISDETLTCWMVRMTAHYRGNEKTIRNMILVCTIGGFCFLFLGFLNSLEFYSLGLASGQITLNSLLLVPAALLTLGVAVVSLISSYYFRTFSKTWGLRQDEIARSECKLAENLGRGLE